MKKMKKILSLMILLVSSTIIYAQNQFCDTVYIQIDNKVELELAVNNYADIDEYIENDLKMLQSILQQSNQNSKGLPYTITYKPNKSVTIKPSDQNERIIWQNNEAIQYQLSNQCIIASTNYSLLIRFNDIENLTSDSLIAKIKEVVNTRLALKKRTSGTYNYAFKGNEMVHKEDYDTRNGQSDVLILKGGVGLNFIKNQPVLDLTGEIGAIFCRRGVWKNNYYISYNQLSSFEADPKINLNGFANIGYRRNLSNRIKNPNWLGLEFGYLVVQNGDLFEKNTFKLGVNWEINRYISVSPQLYFSANSAYPAIRIGIGF